MRRSCCSTSPRYPAGTASRDWAVASTEKEVPSGRGSRQGSGAGGDWVRGEKEDSGMGLDGKKREHQAVGCMGWKFHVCKSWGRHSRESVGSSCRG
jgi:hypothetical protein